MLGVRLRVCACVCARRQRACSVCATRRLSPRRFFSDKVVLAQQKTKVQSDTHIHRNGETFRGRYGEASRLGACRRGHHFQLGLIHVH